MPPDGVDGDVEARKDFNLRRRAALTHHHQFVREQRLAPVHQNTVASTS
jgi:hypothetical protein